MFKEDNELYRQVFSERIDVDKTNKSKDYWNFLHKHFSYGPYICDDCYNFSQKSIDFKNIAIVHIKKNTYRIYFSCMNKNKAKKLIKNFDLIDKTGRINLQ